MISARRQLMPKPELYATLSATRRLALKGRWPAPSLPLCPSLPSPPTTSCAFRPFRRSADRTATQVRPLGKYLEAQTGMKVVFPRCRLRRRRRIAGHAQDRPCLAGRFLPTCRQRSAPMAPPSPSPARGGCQIHLPVRHRRPGHQALADLRQDLRLRCAIVHLRQPDAALLPAAGRLNPERTSRTLPSPAPMTPRWPSSPPARSTPAY